MTKNTIPTIDRISITDLNESKFNQLYLAKNKPVIITNIFDHIPTVSGWSPDYLAKRIGNKKIRVRTSKTGLFTANPTGVKVTPLEMGFADFVGKIENPDPEEKLYMQQVSLLDNFPELAGSDGFSVPNLVAKDKVREVNLWVGPGGNTSQLHYDSNNNFLIQLHGKKKISLYHPFDFYNLYPRSCFSKPAHLTRATDISDTVKYPKVLKAKPFEVTVESGEMLFIPVYWWHLVYSVDAAVSVNVWWDNKFRQHFVPGGLHNFISDTYHVCFK